jgi:hypothetical protein
VGGTLKSFIHENRIEFRSKKWLHSKRSVPDSSIDFVLQVDEGWALHPIPSSAINGG